MSDTDIRQLIDQAAALKSQEATAKSQRTEIETRILSLATNPTPNKKTYKVTGNHAVITVQSKTKTTWDPEACKRLAFLLGADLFHTLFKVEFEGKRKEILKFAAETENDEVRRLLKSACHSEPAKPYIQYEEAAE